VAVIDAIAAHMLRSAFTGALTAILLIRGSATSR